MELPLFIGEAHAERAPPAFDVLPGEAPRCPSRERARRERADAWLGGGHDRAAVAGRRRGRLGRGRAAVTSASRGSQRGKDDGSGRRRPGARQPSAAMPPHEPPPARQARPSTSPSKRSRSTRVPRPMSTRTTEPGRRSSRAASRWVPGSQPACENRPPRRRTSVPSRRTTSNAGGGSEIDVSWRKTSARYVPSPLQAAAPRGANGPSYCVHDRHLAGVDADQRPALPGGGRRRPRAPPRDAGDDRSRRRRPRARAR